MSAQLASLAAEITAVEAEIGRLRAEHARIQRRRDGAAQVAARCRDFLVEKGVNRTQLEF